MLLTLSLALSLAACGGTVAEEPAEEQETEVQEEQVAGPLESVEYTIEKKDHSIRDDQGNVCVEQYFDLVVVNGEGPVVEAINQDLQASYDYYVGELPIDPKEIQGYIDMYTSSGGCALINNVLVEETYNEEGILSLWYTSNWFMGGVANSFYTADVYDLETGDRMTAAEALGVDESVMTYYLKDTIRKYIFDSSNPWDFFPEAEETISDMYTLDIMQYYIGEGGELVLCIPEYDLAPGYMGSFTIPSGIYLNDSKNLQVTDYAAELTSIPVWSSYLEAPNLFGEYRFASDGTCQLLFAYSESDNYVAWTGTWSVDSSGLLVLDLADDYDPSYTVHWEFQLVPVGQTLMMIQKSESGIMNEKGPGYGIAMFPENAI